MEYTADFICFSYTCSAQSPEIVNALKWTNKILLPQTVLYELQQKNDDFETPLFFKIMNKEIQFSAYCGVHEFTAPPGVVHLPYRIMEGLGLTEGGNITIELISPVEGTYMKLRPHKTAFIKLSDPKAILEKAISRDYPLVYKDQTVVIYCPEVNKSFNIDIVETKPTNVIKILNVNINVDFDKPLDYVEPPKAKPRQPQNVWGETKTQARDISANVKMYSKTANYDIKRFPGVGRRLGSS